MASLVLSGDTSGSITVAAPAVAGSNTQTLPAVSGTILVQGTASNIVSGTAVAASGTAVDFTGIPSWAKRITVMFSGVSLSGTDHLLIQIGTSTPTTSGYVSTSGITSGTAVATSTSGFPIYSGAATNTISGKIEICRLSSGFDYIASHALKVSALSAAVGGGDVALAAVMDMVRVTRTGTNTFDAGTINILYE